MTAKAPEALVRAAHQNRLSLAGIEPLRQHATAVFLLPHEGLVARIASNLTAIETAERGVRVARWFSDHGVAVTKPADIEQPVIYDNTAVTFWIYYPQAAGHHPPPEKLGAILRDLHDAPPPPLILPQYQPLADLGTTLERAHTLTRDDRAWLSDERARLLSAYQDIDSRLGVGHVHGDAYPGNLLWDGNNARLGDWDETAIAPRELDLANTFQGVRFGRSRSDLTAFSHAYGYDPTDWAGLITLVAMRELHTLSSYIRKADKGSVPAREQLELRIRTLRRNDRETRWSAA